MVASRVTTQFSGGGVGSANINVLSDGNVLIGQDVFNAQTNPAGFGQISTFALSNTFIYAANFTTTLPVQLELAADVNLDTLTAGSVDIYLKISALP